MILFITSLLISLAIGILLTSLFCPSLKGGAALVFRLFAGGGIGIGITSCLYFICLLTGLTRYSPVFDFGVCLLLGILCFIFFRRRSAVCAPQPLPETGKRSRLTILLAGIFSVELITSVVSYILAFLKEPHGKWDAWLIWNMHARFLFRGGDQWRDAFASGLDWSHWDYPLLLPLSIARGWQYLGGESVSVPAVMAFVFTFMTVGLLLSALSLLRDRTQGFLAAMILLGTPFFIVMGAAQFADVPLAFFILATVVLLSLHWRSSENQTGTLILAGLAAGLCAWTKNEGLLFFLIVAATLFCTTVYTAKWKSALKNTAAFMAGALPVLLMVAYFKTQLSPVNDLMAGLNPAAITARLTDLGRYAEIAKAFFITGISFTQGLIDIRVGMHLNPGAVSVLLLMVYLFLAGVRIDRTRRVGIIQSAAVLGLMLTGYFFVYVLTPLDLGYHIVTSLNRLFLQLWPCIIFLFFMMADSPENAPAPPETGSTSRPKKMKEPQ